MTNPSPQVPAPKKKSNTALIIVIVALLSLFVILPLCVILSIVAIIAINPAGNIPSPTPTPIFTEDDLVWETSVPTEDTEEISTNNIVVNGEDWTSFEYALPDGNSISGYAPISHAFGSDYGTNSALGNSFSFGMAEGENSLRLQFTITEAGWIYYEDDPLAILQSDNGKNLYKYFTENLNSVFYTDSYQTTGCEQYQFFADTETSTSNRPCGTGTMFNHGYIVTCAYQAGSLDSTWMCDEVLKRIKI